MPLGITERPEYVDLPGHIADLAFYRARGYAMAGNRIAIVTDRPEDLVDVHSSSRGKVELGGMTVERCLPRPAMGLDEGGSNCGRNSLQVLKPNRNDFIDFADLAWQDNNL